MHGGRYLQWKDIERERRQYNPREQDITAGNAWQNDACQSHKWAAKKKKKTDSIRIEWSRCKTGKRGELTRLPRTGQVICPLSSIFLETGLVSSVRSTDKNQIKSTGWIEMRWWGCRAKTERNNPGHHKERGRSRCYLMHKEGRGMTNHKHWQEKEWDNYFETGQSRRDTASSLEWAALSLSLSPSLCFCMQRERVGLETCQRPLTRETKELAYLEDPSLQLDTKKCTHTHTRWEEARREEGRSTGQRRARPLRWERREEGGRKEADSCQMESEKDIDNDRCMFGMEADHNRNWYCIWLGREEQIADWMMEIEWMNGRTKTLWKDMPLQRQSCKRRGMLRDEIIDERWMRGTIK